MPPTPEEPLPPLRECLAWAWECARADRRFFKALLALALVVPALTHLPSLLLMFVVDTLSQGRDLSGVRLALLAVLAGDILQAATSLVRQVGGRLLEARLQARMESRAQRAFFRQPFHHQIRQPPGYVNQRIRTDISEQNALFPASFFGYVSSLLSIAAALLIAAVIEPWIAVLAAANVAVTSLLVQNQLRRMRALRRDLMEASAGASRVFVEGVTALKELLALGAVHWQTRRYSRRRSQAARLTVAGSRAWNTISFFQIVLARLATFLALWIGVRLVEAGQLTAGQVVALYTLLNSVFQPTVFLVDAFVNLQNSFIALQRVVSFSRSNAPPARPARAEGFGCRRSLELQDLRFGYPAGAELLAGVTLSARPGDCLVLGGPSGAGKSTLLLLLTGFLEPTSGSLLYDGADVREVPREALRSRIALVPAEGTLFQESVRTNLLLASPAAGDAKLAEALRIADALDFVERLPQGLDTLLDSSGHRLSMGQRQRLLLARALLQDPDVLILDETTSMLDLKTESRVLSRLREAFSDRLLWIVSHRPSVAQAATRVLHLENGRLAEAAPSDAPRAAQ